MVSLEIIRYLRANYELIGILPAIKTHLCVFSMIKKHELNSWNDFEWTDFYKYTSRWTHQTLLEFEKTEKTWNTRTWRNFVRSIEYKKNYYDDSIMSLVAVFWRR